MDDLVGLQQSAKKIRNPFGFDFIVTWDKHPFVLKGDGQWKTVVGPLRNHIAKHLYMKIRYQYHDEQVAKLRAAGRDKDARKFMVSAVVENKIWRMITGEDLHKEVDTELEAQELANLSELHKELKNIDVTAAQANHVANVTEIIDTANAEAINAAGDPGEGRAAHVRGRGRLKPSQDEEAAQTPTDKPQAPVELKATEPGFGDISELDNNE